MLLSIFRFVPLNVHNIKFYHFIVFKQKKKNNPQKTLYHFYLYMKCLQLNQLNQIAQSYFSYLFKHLNTLSNGMLYYRQFHDKPQEQNDINHYTHCN